MKHTSGQVGDTRPRRICHVLTTLGFGGVETRMRVLARAFKGRENEISFIAINDGGAAEAELRALGFEVLCLGAKPSVYSLGTLGKLTKTLRRLRPDVVHAHGAEANFHGLIAARLAGVPIRVGEEIGVPAHSALGRFVFKLAYASASRIVAISNVVAQAIERLGEAKGNQIVVVENPVRSINPKPVADRPADRLRLVYVGRLVEWKEVSNVLHALAALRDRDTICELWIVGAGVERAGLEMLVERLGMAETVRFFGFQDRPEDYVSSSDLFILPSNDKEGFCMALVEAMAAGTPAVSTAVGIAPEVIEDGQTGWLVPSQDIPALTEKLDQVTRLGREAIDRIGTAASRAVLARNSPEIYRDRLDRLYEEAPAA
ncbi:MAG: glycosyltransferase [Oxalobacteraceae bacterium]|nr:MAG: glycosyltransferase [Oxalobacteraceae bacterium]